LLGRSDLHLTSSTRTEGVDISTGVSLTNRGESLRRGGDYSFSLTGLRVFLFFLHSSLNIPLLESIQWYI